MTFQNLTPQQIEEFEEFARSNLPGRSDWSGFHPVLRRVWWELACRHDGMDPAGNFIVFSDGNPYFQNGPDRTRYAVVAIDATVDYLTAAGEESEESGWEEIEERLKDHLRGFNRFRDRAVPTARFIEWEEPKDGN